MPDAGAQRITKPKQPRRKAKESDEDWDDRLLIYEMEFFAWERSRAEKEHAKNQEAARKADARAARVAEKERKEEEKRKSRLALRAEGRDTLAQHYGVDADVLPYFEAVVDIPAGLRGIPCRTPETEHSNLSTPRDQMTGWVLSTLTLKTTEARCDLDCYNCPSHQALLCFAHNATAAALDGAVLSLPTGHGTLAYPQQETTT